MGRFKTPREKKRQSYAHGRVEGGEYPHADRKNRPRVKARGQRKLRRTAKQMLASQPEEVQLLPDGRARGTWSKSGVRLPEHLESTQRARIQREAHNLFRRGYGPATHARFARVVRSWMNGASERSASLAEFYFNELMDSTRPAGIDRRREFLDQFFGQEPELKAEFQNWITALRKNAKVR